MPHAASGEVDGNLAGPWHGGLAMKHSELRESTPLWVWLALGLLILAAVGYLAGYFLFEDILAR